MSDVSADHDPIELVEITDPAAQADLLQAVFDTVLRPSFSTDELPSIDVLRRGASDEHEQTIIVAIDVRGPAAAAVYGRPAGLTVGVLSYLAARPGERGRGWLLTSTNLLEDEPVATVVEHRTDAHRAE